MEPRVEDDREPDDARERDLVDLFCYLACLGPEAFSPSKVTRIIGDAAAMERAAVLSFLLDPDRRDEVSHEIGRLLCARFANRASDDLPSLSGMMPALLAADMDAGFGTLRCLVAGASPALAHDLSEILLTLSIAVARSARSRAGHEAVQVRAVARLRYLLAVLSAIDLDTASKSRLFLALSQSIEDGQVLQNLVLTSLFPSCTEEFVTVLQSGNDDAVRTFLEGAAARPRGKAEFYQACRAVMELGLQQGIPTLGRLDRLLAGGRPGLRALSSMLRSSVLLGFEAFQSGRRSIADQLPPKADLWTQHLLVVVAPGLKESLRTPLCDYILDQSSTMLRGMTLTEAEADVFVEVVVGASVLHARPSDAGARIRRAILDGTGSMHVRLQTRPDADGTPSDVRTFIRVVEQIGAEYRRRAALATTLEAVLPLVAARSVPADVPAYLEAL